MPNLLLELGTEELPPTKLKGLSKAFKDEFSNLLSEQNLNFNEITQYCTPRRLSIIITDLQTQQPDQQNFRRGPKVSVAFADNGNPNQALIGFAKSSGVAIKDLTKISTGKGDWMGATIKTKGKKTIEIIPEVFKQAINCLPIAKRMRWGNSSFEFVRPVHWICAVFGDKVVPIKMFGIESTDKSFGHRFHAPEAIKVSSDNYVAKLEHAKVIVDFSKRQKMISEQVNQVAQNLGGVVKISPELLDEVTSLVEFPVALIGKFDQEFLQVPPEAIVAFMEGHQKFFALFDNNGTLLPNFITISNIVSKHPQQVIDGNERVIRPRLADALFFWEQDLALDLDDLYLKLEKVVYQKQLGSIKDKLNRVTKLSQYLGKLFKIESKEITTACKYCKVDLLSQMVGEFPKLQGTMGKYYAENQGISPSITQAIAEHYLPKFADDILPESRLGQIIAIAERIDTLVAIFAIGQVPTGDKDPFGLRRATLGVLRIIIEKQLEFNIFELVNNVLRLLPADPKISDDTLEQIEGFILARLKGLLKDSKVFVAIDLHLAGGNVLDFVKRERAVSEFTKHTTFESLVKANKRIANFFNKFDASPINKKNLVDQSLFQEPDEYKLHQEYLKISDQVFTLTSNAEYLTALGLLAKLAPIINDYFENVMVMTDDEKLRDNRLALLANLQNLFLQIADLSKLT